ncbi:hypothetical protein [Paracoccus hibiscisoli]|uniref:Uncharacterized protein n=1 Tax=Paracoccus hibiscisoli TaxID=2023261 RepID=A0A4U0QUN1_9RHOB|nr:hypothetical protein [Paracoccus hibiscisoli]TJZ85807.1 hypothetical protein FA740_05250 [Paracoccus hibiscisoli]
MITALAGFGGMSFGTMVAYVDDLNLEGWLMVIAILAVSGCVLAYAGLSSIRPGRSLVGTWIDLKRAEMQAKHDSIRSGRE